MTKGKIAAQWVPSTLPLVNGCLTPHLSDAGEAADPSVFGLLTQPFSHATLACYKALSKANPAVSTDNCVTIVETEVHAVGEALGENWTSKNRRSMQVRGGIASIASHSPKSKSCSPINSGRVRASPRSTSHVLLTTFLPVDEHR